MTQSRQWLAQGLASAAIMQLLAGCAQAGEPPSHPAGPVSDLADILPPKTEAALDRKLRDYLETNGTALVVASVPSLDGQPIEKVSLGLAEEWDIGDPKTFRGLLVLVAPNEREVRIEVSCGLENVISDVAASRVIREDMLPLFKEGELAAGTVAGVEALISRIDAGAPNTDACGANLREAA